MIAMIGGVVMKVDIDESALDMINHIDSVLEITGMGGMTFQVEANEGQEITVVIPKISLKNMGISEIDCTTVEGAREAMDQIGAAIDFISEVRSKLGAYENRFEHTISSLNITDENMTAAYSRITHEDIAT